jgi:hypothetical protein
MTEQAGFRSAVYWHERAEEARTLADGMRDKGVKATMKTIARMYDELSERAAKREAKDSN